MADIRRLSAYDRSIKGHRQDNLAIVAWFSPNLRPFIGVCGPTVRCPRPLWSQPTVGRWLPDSVPITKSKKKKSANDRRKKNNLAPSTENYQSTRKQPKSDTTSTDGSSTVASYFLFWPRRHRLLVSLGNVTAIQEPKLSTEVRGNYSACRYMTISYPDWSLYISFHCDKKKKKKHTKITPSRDRFLGFWIVFKT